MALYFSPLGYRHLLDGGDPDAMDAAVILHLGQVQQPSASRIAQWRGAARLIHLRAWISPLADDWAERRARQQVGSALHLSRVRSGEVLGLTLPAHATQRQRE